MAVPMTSAVRHCPRLHFGHGGSYADMETEHRIDEASSNMQCNHWTRAAGLQSQNAWGTDLALLLLRGVIGGEGRLPRGAGATVCVVDGLAADGALRVGAGVHPPVRWQQK